MRRRTCLRTLLLSRIGASTIGGLGQRLLRLLLELSSLLRVHMPNPVSLPPSSQKKKSVVRASAEYIDYIFGYSPDIL